MTEPVLYETRGAVAIATLNRPEASNALDQAALEGLWRAFEAFRDDRELRVLILTGAGDRAFCAGQDLKELATDGLGAVEYPILGKNITIDKPVIAAVNGIAYGGGLLLSLVCDLCVASSAARFGATEARWGRGLGWAAPLTRLMPPRVVMELLMTAQPISADRAYELGLVNRVTTSERLLPDSIDLAETIAANAPLSVDASKAMVWQAINDPDLQAESDRLFEPVYASADAIEGPLAFREKRPPAWTGR
jgi:enoyl-CoA hydratase/carnithine racemase